MKNCNNNNNNNNNNNSDNNIDKIINNIYNNNKLYLFKKCNRLSFQTRLLSLFRLK